MATTAPNMGLKVWNLLTDPYDHSQLADNWAKVDQHNHTEGKGVQIPTAGLADGAVSTAKIGNEQLTGEKLAAAVAEAAGINTGARTYRKFVSNEEAYSNSTTSYTLVDSGTVYVPANGRLMVTYVSLHKSTTSNGTVQMFVDGTEVKSLAAGGAPAAATVATSEFASFFGPLVTVGSNAATLVATKGVTADSSYVTSGMSSQAGTTVLFNMSTGNHKVEIKAKAGAAGKIEIANRLLWLKAEAYA